MFLRRLWILALLAVAWMGGAGPLAASKGPAGTVTAEDLAGYADYPAELKSLVDRALDLSRRGLAYTYGSADPAKGGMDCSGTIHHLLNAHGLGPLPRQADGFYRWVWKAGTFRAVNSPKFGGFEFEPLQPGHLLFWSGTYSIQRDPPVTHVMLYLGRLKDGGRPVMFGASDDRPWQGERRGGVGVFDFTMPRAGGSARFLGYAAIPGLENRTGVNGANGASTEPSPEVPAPSIPATP